MSAARSSPRPAGRDDLVDAHPCRSRGPSAIESRSATMSPPVSARLRATASASTAGPRRGARRCRSRRARAAAARAASATPRATRRPGARRPRAPTASVQGRAELRRAERGGADEDGCRRVLLLRHGRRSAARALGELADLGARRGSRHPRRCTPTASIACTSASPSSVTGQRVVCQGASGAARSELARRTPRAGRAPRPRAAERARRTTASVPRGAAELCGQRLGRGIQSHASPAAPRAASSPRAARPWWARRAG